MAPPAPPVTRSPAARAVPDGVPFEPGPPVVTATPRSAGPDGPAQPMPLVSDRALGLPTAPFPTAPPPRLPSRRRRALLALLVALLLVSAAGAALGWRLIAGYAAIPIVPAAITRDIVLAQPGARPMSGAFGVVVTPTGAVFVADENPRRLLFFPDGQSASGRVIGSEAGPEHLLGPHALAFSPDGVVLLLDRPTGMVSFWSEDGAYLRSAKLGSPGARAIAVDDTGAIYVADTGASVIRKFTPDGQPDLTWGDAPEAGVVRLPEVVGLAWLGIDLYAAARGEIVRLDQGGRVTSRATPVGNADSLAATPSGLLLASDLATNRVWVLDADGQTLARVAGMDGDEDLFDQPRGLTVTADNTLYVVNDTHVTVYQLPEAWP